MDRSVWARVWPCLVLALWLGACTDDVFEEENRKDVVDQTTADSSDELRMSWTRRRRTHLMS